VVLSIDHYCAPNYIPMDPNPLAHLPHIGEFQYNFEHPDSIDWLIFKCNFEKFCLVLG
jgi:hypothetical protein